MAEKILQSESLMAMLPKMLGRMFDVGMTAEKIAVKFTAAMGKIMPLVGIGSRHMMPTAYIPLPPRASGAAQNTITPMCAHWLWSARL